MHVRPDCFDSFSTVKQGGFASHHEPKVVGCEPKPAFLRRNPLDNQTLDVRPLAGVLEGDGADVPLGVNVEHGVFVETPLLGDVAVAELDVERVGGLEIIGFHRPNLQPKKAL